MSKMTALLLYHFIVVGSLLFRGCGERPQECTEFLDLPRQQRESQFKSYSVEKQIDMYLCARKVEPPQLGFAYDIADGGENAVPIVVQKLKATDKEIDQQDLIYVLEVMSDRGLLRGRKDVIADISDVIDKMKISQAKQSSLESLKKIEANSGIKPFTYVQ
jgi:hypothetical protein